MTYTGFSTRTDEELVRAILDLDDVPSVVRELVYRVECALNALGELEAEIAIEDLDELVCMYKDAVHDADTEREKVKLLKEQVYNEEQENLHLDAKIEDLDAKIEDLEDEIKELREQLGEGQ